MGIKSYSNVYKVTAVSSQTFWCMNLPGPATPANTPPRIRSQGPIAARMLCSLARRNSMKRSNTPDFSNTHLCSHGPYSRDVLRACCLDFSWNSFVDCMWLKVAFTKTCSFLIEVASSVRCAAAEGPTGQFKRMHCNPQNR